MKLVICLSLSIFFLFGTSSYGQSKISAIKAKLFFSEKKAFTDNDPSGGFSPNIIDNPKFFLWNTSIGEGSAEGCSDQVIIIIEISSKVYSYKTQTLRLTTSQEKKTTVQQNNFSILDSNGNFKMLFLLNDVGCGKLKLKAELVSGTKTVSALSKSIDFACGE